MAAATQGNVQLRRPFQILAAGGPFGASTKVRCLCLLIPNQTPILVGVTRNGRWQAESCGPARASARPVGPGMLFYAGARPLWSRCSRLALFGFIFWTGIRCAALSPAMPLTG